MGSLCMKFNDDRCKGKAIMWHKRFSVINALWPWSWTPKSIGHILDSWGVFVWSLMMIDEKEKQLCNINHFQLSMHCDLDLWTPKSIEHILTSWGVFVWSFMMIVLKGKKLCNLNHFQLSMHCDLDLWHFDPETHWAHPRLTGSLCMKFHDDRWKGKAIMRH